MQRSTLEFSVLIPILALIVLTSGCVHNTYESIAIDNTPVSYRTNVGTLPEVSRKGQATIVFESGIGDGLSSWDTVYQMLSQSYHLFAYSRPGYQGSENLVEKDGKRTSDEVAIRLKNILQQANIPGPYVLVAHSAGGLYSLKFAELYPDQVKAIVLVDGRPKQFNNRCEDAGVSPCAPPEFLANILPSHLKYEIRGLSESESLTPNPEQIPGIPITVLAATKPPPGAPRGAQKIWLAVQREFAESVKQGRYLVAQGSGHYIHKDRPNLVAKEIKKML